MSNTLKLGNGKWATGKDTLLSFSDTNNNYKPLPFSFSRASSATVVNKDGLIETVGSGEPRIDFKDNTKGALLLEPTRTNLINQSQTFIGGWSKINGVVVSGEKVTSPDGTLNASQLVFNGTTGGRIERGITGLTQGADYTVSVYARVSSGTQVVNFGSVNDFEYTLTTKWQRLTRTQPENDTTAYPRFRCDDAATIEIYAFQLEVGSYATSYIPTSGQANGVTRVAESSSQTVPDGVIGQTEGTFFLDFKKERNGLEVWSINDGTSSNRVYMGFNDSNFISQVRSSNGSAQASFTTALNNNTRYKCALAYKLNDFVLYINGVQIGTDNNGVVPLNMSKLSAYASTSSDAPFFSPTNDVKLYNTRLSNSELAALTTI